MCPEPTTGHPTHGGEFVFGDPLTWGVEQAVTTTDTAGMAGRSPKRGIGYIRG